MNFVYDMIDWLQEQLPVNRLVILLSGPVLALSGAVSAYVALGGSSGEESVFRPAAGTGTLDWRIQGWSELLEGLSDRPVEWLIGEPLGSGFTRVVLGLEVQAEPPDRVEELSALQHERPPVLHELPEFLHQSGLVLGQRLRRQAIAESRQHEQDTNSPHRQPPREVRGGQSQAPSVWSGRVLRSQ